MKSILAFSTESSSLNTYDSSYRPGETSLKGILSNRFLTSSSWKFPSSVRYTSLPAVQFTATLSSSPRPSGS